MSFPPEKPKSSAKPRILLLTTADNIGGMERVVCGLARQFTRRGWPTQTVFPEGGNKDALLAWCAAQGVDAQTSPAVLNAAAEHRRSDMAALRTFVRKTQPDVVNVHYGDNFISLKDVLAIRLAGGCRCIVTVHHPTVWDSGNARKQRMTALAARLAHGVVAVSRATRDVLLAAGVPASKMQIVFNGLQPPAASLSREDARARLHLPPSAFVVGTLARLVSHKGIGELIDAAARVADPKAELLLVVAGEGPERMALESQAAARLKDRVVFLGRVADVDEFYAACDVFCLPSHMEGFGLVYVEAAFHGVPSIGTNVGGIPDAIADGQTGLLVAPGDLDALAQAIQTLRDDPELRRRMGDAARARAEAEFTEVIMAVRYEEIFRRKPPVGERPQ